MKRRGKILAGILIALPVLVGFGMHGELSGNVSDGLFFFQDFLDNLSLEGGGMAFSHGYSSNVFPPHFVSKSAEALY